MQLKIDSEFQNLIPPLTEEEYKQLEANLISDGCREPLVVWGETIIDGHNRHKICNDNDIPFKTENKDFKDRTEAIEWIILNQFGRRNLSPFQRSQLALRLKPLIQEKAKENQKTSTGGINPQPRQKSAQAEKIKTRDELAKIAGVSHDTIDKTEKILKEGTEYQIRRASQGGKGNAVNTIYREIKGENDTKTCNKCGQELPLTEFYEGKGICKKCFNSNPRAPRDLKGNILKIDPALKKITEEEVVGDLYNEDKIIEYDINDLIEEFNGNFSTYLSVLDGILEQHKELINNPENNKKIMAILSEAEIAMSKMKGKYIYE